MSVQILIARGKIDEGLALIPAFQVNAYSIANGRSHSLHCRRWA